MPETQLYGEVTEMFRHLITLDVDSPAYRRQREAIARRCLPLANHIALRYRGRGESHEDLVQVARVGLMNAINRFDVDNGADFLAFAVPTMMGEVRRYFRDSAWSVKVPRGMKELVPQVDTSRAELSQATGKAPTATEIATHLGIVRELVVEASIAGGNYSTMSTDAPISADGGETMFADKLSRIDPDLDKVLQVETVRPLIAALPERERTILRLRFFHEMTQTQIGGRLGCSQMHVSRLLAKALQTVRDQAGDAIFAQAG